MIDDQQVGLGPAGDFRELRCVGVVLCSIRLKIRPLRQPFERVYLMNKNVTTVACIDGSLGRVRVA